MIGVHKYFYAVDKRLTTGSSHVCPICKSKKKISVVERSTQTYFVDIDGYVNEHLQKELLKKIPETMQPVTTSGIQAKRSMHENVLQKYQ